MKDKDVQVVEREELYRGFMRIARYRLRHTLHRGGWSPEIVRERVEGLRAASVLLYDPGLDAVLLVEQFRVGALEAGTGAWLLETVGGYVPPGESAADVARREVLEETGCDVAELEHVCDFYVSPGYSTEQISLFCGHVDAASAGGVHGLPEEGEDILVRVFPADEAIAGISSGMANSTSLIIGLQWLALHRSELRLRWS
jgi:ADP-ribose pyrophosphatase